MLETSSERAAEAVTPFASPMLASIERLVSRLTSRVAGPQSQFSGRSLQFAERIFARQLASLGSGPLPEALPAEREIEPQKWLLPDSWVPPAAALRGGARGVVPAAKVAAAAAPAALRTAAPPLVMAVPARQPETVQRPAGAVAAAPPAASPTLDGDVAGTAATPAGAGVVPSAQTDSAAVATAQAAIATLASPILTAPAGEQPAAVAAARAPAAEQPAVAAAARAPAAAQSAAPAAALSTTADEQPAPGATASPQPAPSAAPGTSSTITPAAPLAAVATPAVAATPPTAESGTTTAAASGTTTAAASAAVDGPGAALPAAAVAPAPRAGAAASGLGDAAGARAAATSPVTAGVDPASLQPGAPEAPASSARAGEQARGQVAAAPGLRSGRAGASAGEETDLPQSSAPAGLVSAAAAIGGRSAEVGSPATHPPRPVGAEPVAPESRAMAAASPVAQDAGAALPAKAGVAAAPSLSGAAVPPGETRVRDWLQPLLRRPVATGAVPAGRASAFARSLGHLSWSDARLGHQSAQQGLTATPGGEADDELAGSPRAAAAPSLPMVQATELTPRAAARGARPASKAGTPVAAQLSQVEPLHRPVVAAPLTAERAPALPAPALASPTGAASGPLGSAITSDPTSAVVPAVAAGRPRPATAPDLAATERALTPPALPLTATVPTGTAPAGLPARAAGELASAPQARSGAAPRPGRQLQLGGAEGAAFAPLSPRLLDSAALQRPREQGPASFVELFLAGQAARLASPSAWSLPALATNQPYRTPGALGLHTEQMANFIGAHAAAGSAGVNNPFGGVQRWRLAPGLSGTVARALGSAAPPGAARWAQLSLSKELPYLESPDGEPSAELQAPAPAALADAARATPPLTVAAPARAAVAEAAATPARSSALGSLGADAPFAAPAQAGSEPGAPRPWQLAGGMATLAELFAAGVGLGSGAADVLARQAGVAPTLGLMPPWLTAAAGPTGLGLVSAPGAGPRTVEHGLVTAGAPASVPSEDPLARALRRGDAAPPAASLPPQLVAGQAAATAPAAAYGRPVPTAALPFWQQAGGIAATAEAFARGHGIERADSRALGAAARATGGRWIPITGGMVFIDDETPAESTAAAHQAPGGGLPASSAVHPLSLVSTATAGRLPAGGMDPASPLGAWPPAAAASELALSPDYQQAGRPTGARAAAGARGIEVGRVGGLGLRSELFAAGLGTAELRARPLSAAQERATWSLAPGVTAPLAEALQTAEPQTPPRWAFGERGLLFLSEPGVAKAAGRGRAVSRGTAGAPISARSPSGRPEGTPSTAAPERGPAGRGQVLSGAAAAAAGEVASSGDGMPLTAGALGPAAGPASAGWSGFPAPSQQPWLRAGGMAILAELFSAGVGLGAGAVSSLAQQAGVAAGRGLLPGWLARLLKAEQSQPSADEEPGPGTVLPFVARDQEQRVSGRLAGGPRRRAASTLAPSLPAAGTAGAATEFGPAMPGVSAAQPWSAATAASTWQRAGGLGASAEAFARGHGLARTDGDSADYEDSVEAPAGRWLAVSGGLVFVPAERPATAAGKRGSATTRPAARTAALPPAQLPAVAPAGSLPDGSRVGGLGLRSELFVSGLGQSASGVARTGSDPLGGWAGAHRLLTGFPQQEVEAPVPPSRFAWSGAGGLLYLAGASPARGQQRTAATARRSQAVAPAAASPGATAGAQATAPLPGGVAALAEQFGAARRSVEPSVSEAPAAASRPLPLAAGFGGRAALPSTGAATGAALPGLLAEAMLSGRARGGGAEAAAASGSPRAMQSADRLTRLLSQLPAQWLPSAAVTTAMQSSGVTESAIWQRLPASLTRLAAAALRGDSAGAGDDSSEDSSVERHSHLTLVKGSSPAATQKAQRAAEPAWKQQTPQAMVSAALQKVAGSGTPMAAAAKMLETMRGQGGSQGVRPDDRLSLGDLTLIAISMGDNRMAAISKSGTPSTVPHVESALRQDDHQLVQPETEHTMNQKIDALAKMCLKYVEKHEKMMNERGSFDT